ncbi:acetyltransferase [Domibacillus indicus]|uniref:acetyltransferase n=1 Tax=Domibacillus indicus TaxID=1437523 RepID=UPI0006181113|nr:acetyltransferase [Domibacillus indicus]
MNKPIILLGNGGHASVLTDILLQQRREIIGFTAPVEEPNHFNLSYLGTDEEIDSYSSDEVKLVLAIGSIRVSPIRAMIFQKMKEKGYLFASVIHPSAIISSYAEIGEGVQIMAGTVVQAFAKIADNTIVNTSSVIEHDCEIGEHCHIAPGVTLSGNVRVGRGTHIGIGTSVIQNTRIGSNALVGAGSIVLKEVKENQTVYGVPAKEVTKWNDGNRF